VLIRGRSTENIDDQSCVSPRADADPACKRWEDGGCSIVEKGAVAIAEGRAASTYGKKREIVPSR